MINFNYSPAINNLRYSIPLKVVHRVKAVSYPATEQEVTWLLLQGYEPSLTTDGVYVLYEVHPGAQ